MAISNLAWLFYVALLFYKLIISLNKILAFTLKKKKKMFFHMYLKMSLFGKSLVLDETLFLSVGLDTSPCPCLAL